MATVHPAHLPPTAQARRARPRWFWPSVVAAALLLAYGAGLGWVATRLGDDIAAHVQPLPVASDDQHAAR